MDGSLTETSYDTYRRQAQEKSLEYQDFLSRALSRRGIILQNMTSRKYQFWSENLLGLEIKFDDMMERTGRLYIETAEKAEPREGDYVPAGIYRDDECWLYGIGNYQRFFIFGKKTLQRLDHYNPDWLFHPQEDKPTSKGFCIPVEKAQELAERVIEFLPEERGME
ncbi:MAG: hypothetical protein Q8Q12_00500 [bacterium]|nr:hypothetical protein [bacterium]